LMFPVLSWRITGVLVSVWFGTGRGAWVVITGAESTSDLDRARRTEEFHYRPEAAMTVMPDTVEIDLGPLRIKGLLGIPSNAEGLVIFAHGSGSGRLSPRNN